MGIKVSVPSIGESVTEAEISQWLVEDGQYVEKDDEIAEIDSEKATISISADASGRIKILVKAGEVVKIGAVIAEIESGEQSVEPSKASEEKATHKPKASEKETPHDPKPDTETKTEKQLPKDSVNATPLAKQMMVLENIDPQNINKQASDKIKRKEVESYIQNQKMRQSTTSKMSMLRRKLSERLVAVKNQTAMLTTFNEVDMSAIDELRNKHQDTFKSKHNVKLGFMSFFVRASTLALKEFPQVNAAIDDNKIITYDYADISIAVSTDKGLMVPVIRNAELLSLSEIEKKLLELSEKARNNSISIDDMTGGTFTITNGGVFGSMLSTPIINPPQSAILGMHTIKDRAVVVNGQIVVRPMMYLALSYDHRIIDGKESVGFIVSVKNLLETPSEMLQDGDLT